MNSEEINAVIDNLCEKLGTTASKLLPEIAKMKTAECIATIAILVIAVVLGAMWLKYLVKRNVQAEWGDDLAGGALLMAAIAEPIMAVFCAYNIMSLAGWLASPTAKALFEIIDLVK